MKQYKIRDATKILIDLMDQGKGDWDLTIEDEDGAVVINSQVVATKPKGMEVLFG